MDLAYLGAVLRSSYMPPFDPWFGGGYINYYYWGQFIVAMFIKATGIQPAVAFNLAVPTFFALTIGGAFSVVYNLAESTRRGLIGSFPLIGSARTTELGSSSTIWELARRRAREQGISHAQPATGASMRRDPLRPSHPHPDLPRPSGKGLSPLLAGICGALFVAVLGNLDGAAQVGHGIWRAAVQNAPFGAFDFWRSSRMMAPDPPGHEITEFPFFTFLFADLHAHMMAIPFTLLSIGLSLALVLAAPRRAAAQSHWGAGEIARLAVLGVVVGSLRLINAWDFPTYLLIGAASVFLAEFLVQGGLGTAMLARAIVKSALVFAAGYLAFLPFHLAYETFVSGVESTTNTTVLWQFLAISGLFVFIIGTFFIRESGDLLVRVSRSLSRRVARVARAASSDDEGGHGANAWSVLELMIGALLIGFALTAVLSGVGGSTVPFAAALLALALIAGYRWLSRPRTDTPPLAFAALLVCVSLALVVALDFLRIENDIERMNSVFKFYLQVWVLMALASAYLLWRMVRGRRVSAGNLTLVKKAWTAALAVLVISAAVYPVMGTHDRLRDRFDTETLPLTLDGTAYAEQTVYRDEHGDIDLSLDFEGIRWLQDNVEGSPITLEGLTPSYRWGGRISVYTGLPSVVGWQWHQQQQRGDYAWAVNRRIDDVNDIYSTTDARHALRLLREYNVRYVYVGKLERLYYPEEGIRKFDDTMSDSLDKVFQNDEVTIYRVRDGA